MLRVQIILLFYFVCCEVSVGFNSFPQVISTNEELENHLSLNNEFDHSTNGSEVISDSGEMDIDPDFLVNKKRQEDIKKYEKYLSLFGIKQTIDPDIIQETFMTTVSKNSLVIKRIGVLILFCLEYFIISITLQLQPQLIKKYKYDVEVHHVTTTDGYILELHRITGGPKSPVSGGKKPVFLMHGLLDSSGTWVIMRPTHGLGILKNTNSSLISQTI